MGIKRVKLNYQPIAKRSSNEIAYKISQSHITALQRSIHQKKQRNAIELQESNKDAKNFVVKNNSVKILVKSKLYKRKKEN